MALTSNAQNYFLKKDRSSSNCVAASCVELYVLTHKVALLLNGYHQTYVSITFK